MHANKNIDIVNVVYHMFSSFLGEISSVAIKFYLEYTFLSLSYWQML
jgi:hypothetical protein